MFHSCPYCTGVLSKRSIHLAILLSACIGARAASGSETVDHNSTAPRVAQAPGSTSSTGKDSVSSFNRKFSRKFEDREIVETPLPSSTSTSDSVSSFKRKFEVLKFVVGDSADSTSGDTADNVDDISDLEISDLDDTEVDDEADEVDENSEPDSDDDTDLEKPPATTFDSYYADPLDTSSDDDVDEDEDDEDGNSIASVEISHRVANATSVVVALDLENNTNSDSKFDVMNHTNNFVAGNFDNDSAHGVGTVDISDLYIEDNLTFKSYDIQTTFGRHSIYDDRGWWWDDSFDGLQIHAYKKHWSVNLGLGRNSSSEANGWVNNDKAALLLGSATYEKSPHHTLSAHFFSPFRYGNVRDEDDNISVTNGQKTLWSGLGAAGSWPSGKDRSRRSSYRVDIGKVLGEFAEEDDDDDSVEQIKVDGWALDAAFAYTEPRLRFEPTVSLGVAFTSKDTDSTAYRRNIYKQTGFQGNEAPIGNTTFSRYGSLISPELSNLQVVTLASSFNLRNEGSLVLSYHNYRQMVASDEFESDLDLDPDGESRKLGHAFEIEWERPFTTKFGDDIDISFSAGIFQYGSAYGEDQGTRTYDASMEIEFEFE